MPRSGPGPRIGSPKVESRPRVGNSRPAISRSIVVLPQPEGPINEMISFSRNVTVMSSSAVKVPLTYCLVMFRASTASVRGAVGCDTSIIG